METLADWTQCKETAECTHEGVGTTCKKVGLGGETKLCVLEGEGWAGGVYNLQLYGWVIESKWFGLGFGGTTCGNAWLGVYNACTEEGGIGTCGGGGWATTVEGIVACGEAGGGIGEEERDAFCSCMTCAFGLAAGTGDGDGAGGGGGEGEVGDYLYMNAECEGGGTPTFSEAISELAAGICGIDVAKLEGGGCGERDVDEGGTRAVLGGGGLVGLVGAVVGAGGLGFDFW